jgi:hypothetical protein
MDTGCFAGEIIGGLEDSCDSEKRNTPNESDPSFRQRAHTQDKNYTVYLERSGFKRMEHPPYIPDLAHITVFLWLHE